MWRVFAAILLGLNAVVPVPVHAPTSPWCLLLTCLSLQDLPRNPLPESCLVINAEPLGSTVRIYCNNQELLSARVSKFEGSAFIQKLINSEEVKGKEVLQVLEQIAEIRGVEEIKVLDGSQLRLFRKNVRDNLPNPYVRSTILCTLLTGLPRCYYTSQGFIYADERTQTRILQASKELISVTIQDVLRILGNVDQKGQGQATSADIERVSTLLRAESPQSKFRNLFVKLHRSAENGNAEDRESLLAIVNVVPWSLIPGFDVLQYPSTLRKKLTKS